MVGEVGVAKLNAGSYEAPMLDVAHNSYLAQSLDNRVLGAG
jgi:hypothetical protein